MVRSKLRNKYLKSKSEIDKQRYNRETTVLLTDVMEETDPVLKAIKKYKNHPSILRIKSFF